MSRFKRILEAAFGPAQPEKPKILVTTKKKKSFFNLFNSLIGNKKIGDESIGKQLISKHITRSLVPVQGLKASTMPAVDSTDKETMDRITEMQKVFTVDSSFFDQVPGFIGNWFENQTFIGYQMCAILAQHWLIDKACTMPGDDAVRKGYDITLNDGKELKPEQLDYIRELDDKFAVNDNMVEYVRMSRIFGIRLALFLVDDIDYSKPFNIDGVKPGSYKGITQVDPYWVAPILDSEASSNPINKNFYVPTWWQTGGMKIHRSHLMVLIPFPVADIMKPSYLFGGVPLTQKIYERVYNAERCASEGVQLLQTKRTGVIFTDLEQAIADQAHFEELIAEFAKYRDNYAIKVLGEDERYEQQDTSLSDLDNTIMTQYKLVAAIAGVPAQRLLQDSPAGSLNSTGESEAETYREMLESIQSKALTPFLKRHYEILARSHLVEKYPELADANFIPSWVELDSMTEKERADTNYTKAQTDQILRDCGAVDADMIHDRIIKDPNSGYTGVQMEPEDDLDDEDDENSPPTDQDNPDKDVGSEGGEENPTSPRKKPDDVVKQGQ